MNLRTLLLLALVAAVSAGCGQTGALYLPGDPPPAAVPPGDANTVDESGDVDPTTTAAPPADDPDDTP